MAARCTSMKCADMPLETQAKVLRVLLDQTFQRVGGTKKVKVDVRILSSTARDLQAGIVGQTFREDLYHRLSVVPVRVPALSERREDIPALIEHFAHTYSAARPDKRHGALPMMQLHCCKPATGRAMCANLRNNVERIMILAAGEGHDEITRRHIPGGDHANRAMAASVANTC